MSFIKAAKKAAGGGSLIGKLKGRKSSGGGAGGGGEDPDELEANGDSPLANGAAVRSTVFDWLTLMKNSF